MSQELKAKSQNNYAILLAGGQGSRFWPLSRVLEPKQFLPLHKEKSLFEQTIQRVKKIIPTGNLIIATSELYRNQIIELVSPYKIPLENLVFETEGKNTAPSIAVSVQIIHNRNPSARIAILPCDHLIKNNKKFIGLLSRALSICENSIVIFGIPPNRAATGYGYIKVKSQKSKVKSQKNFAVEKFFEKPDLKKAQKFIRSGDYYWNSGIFVGSGKTFLKEFKTNLLYLYKLLNIIRKPQDINLIWGKVAPISFDYAILEKALNVVMLVADDLGWSDLGSWQAWDEILKKDRQGNIIKADVINIGSENISVLGTNRLIATIGLADLIIVDTPDALLVTQKDKTENVKKVVDILKQRQRQEHYAHKTVKRPWGSYTVLEIGDGFKVKLVEVKPGKSLSLQLHKKRSEHWVVVEGQAKITRGSKSYKFYANESTYIPVNCIHRLMNPGRTLLKIVEVQAGKYLEEDDIVRLKDDFGRN